MDPPIRPRPTIPTLLKVVGAPWPGAGRPGWMTGRELDMASAISHFVVLRPPPPPRDRLEADAAADGRRDDPQLGHQTIELRGKHRLRAVAQGVIGFTMHFDDEPIGPGGH